MKEETMAPALVCGVRDSQESEPVVRVAAALTERLGLRLLVAHAVPPPTTVGVASVPYVYPFPDYHAGRESARAILRDLAGRAPVTAGAELRPLVGDAAASLLALAEEEHARLIVVGTRGRGVLKAALLGSVSSALATRATCPVVVVPPEYAMESGEPRPIVCGVDDSKGARVALRFASGLAERLEAPLVLAHAIETGAVPGTATVPGAREELRTMEQRNADLLLAELAVEAGLGDEVARRTAFGKAAETLADFARADGAQLVVTGTRGRGRLSAALLGSVSQALPGLSGVPVAIVPTDVEPDPVRPAAHADPHSSRSARPTANSTASATAARHGLRT